MLWCWRRLSRVLWTAKRSNQSILKKVSPEYSLDGLMLKLKLHYFGHLMQKANSLEKNLTLGQTEGRRRRDELVRWHHQVIGLEFERTLGEGEGQGSVACCSEWGRKESDMSEWRNNSNKMVLLASCFILVKFRMLKHVQECFRLFWTWDEFFRTSPHGHPIPWPLPDFAPEHLSPLPNLSPHQVLIGICSLLST